MTTLVAVVAFVPSRFNPVPQLIDTAMSSNERQTFPHIDTTGFTDQQNKLLSVLKTEYPDNPAGEKYSQGESQAWCANFVSWVYKESDAPFVNPNSGSWRIPGTVTLREYLIEEGEFKPRGYTPTFGDLMFYDNPSSFGQHVNIVLRNDNGKITSIGGNEPGGIRVIQHERQNDAGFLGYGAMNQR